ncbi:hypothetical protein MWU54_15675 [Marivita sp. S6314]|uniref:4'-phosphopantetheinyl transferase family protein n=1 Tax=Marivita sp. S6314 TaxID=2926406 RepID=UPI001FF3FD7A|nr:hypothetical protein [Marivita sp. S6314]MCK0151482.1 hypothetical protein [Marivita sp. S6314]
MTRQTQPELNGFLTDLRTEWLFPDTVLLTARYHVDLYHHDLHAISGIPLPDRLGKAVTKRRAEFLAGRLLARQGQTALGCKPRTVPIAANRAPVWPDGITGSLTHAKSQCAALVSTNTDRTLGIDCEAIANGTSLTAIRSQTLTITDLGWISSPYEATCLFSAKETLFKALFPQVNRVFGFSAAELTAAIGPDTLSLQLTENLTDTLVAGTGFTITHRQWETHVLTWLAR